MAAPGSAVEAPTPSPADASPTSSAAAASRRPNMGQQPGTVGAAAAARVSRRGSSGTAASWGTGSAAGPAPGCGSSRGSGPASSGRTCGHPGRQHRHQLAIGLGAVVQRTVGADLAATQGVQQRVVGAEGGEVEGTTALGVLTRTLTSVAEPHPDLRSHRVPTGFAGYELSPWPLRGHGVRWGCRSSVTGRFPLNSTKDKVHITTSSVRRSRNPPESRRSSAGRSAPATGCARLRPVALPSPRGWSRPAGHDGCRSGAAGRSTGSVNSRVVGQQLQRPPEVVQRPVPQLRVEVVAEDRHPQPAHVQPQLVGTAGARDEPVAAQPVAVLEAARSGSRRWAARAPRRRRSPRAA